MTHHKEMRLRRNLPFRRGFVMGRGKLVGIRAQWKLLNERGLFLRVESRTRSPILVAVLMASGPTALFSLNTKPCTENLDLFLPIHIHVPHVFNRGTHRQKIWRFDPLPYVMVGSSSRRRAVFRLALESMPELTGDCTSLC